MTANKQKPLGPTVERAPLLKLTIFDVTEAELEALERGTTESLFLNLGVAVIAIACSFLISLLTTNIESIKTFCCFVIVTIVGYIAGVAFLLLWWQGRRSLKKVAQEIRSRRPPKGVQESGDVATEPRE